MTNLSALLREHNIPFWKQLIASGLFTGLSPVASGTVASAVAVLFYFIPGFANPWVLLASGAVAFFVGLWLAGPCEEAIGDDPSFVTIDEFAGQWITLASPLVMGQPQWQWAVICFFTFRAFDIAKLWPASYFDRRRGPLGIMADDVVAGIYANIASHIIWYGLSFAGLVTKFLGEQ
ncbi:MAG: phosphatidylglycerophosphatase A [Chlorobi bacterium]|jgi:phosphatidylglycerophosphatase A|nr:phosphatidylglycerophosphatase A [Chlorobiota bacterium]